MICWHGNNSLILIHPSKTIAIDKRVIAVYAPNPLNTGNSTPARPT
jgi:hypothetical protein